VQVILTPTAVADKFGVGLNGFADSVPGPATQLSEQWFDSVQMELVNVIIGQGIALDGLQFDQLKQAIDDYTFVDPIVTGSLTIDSGAAMFIASGAGFVLQNGSTFAVESGVTLIAADNTWVWGTSNANDWTINGDVTLGTDGTNTVACLSPATCASTLVVTGILSPLAGINLGGQAIAGTAGSIVDTETLAVTEIRFDNSGTTLPGTPGYVRWNGTFFSLMDEASQIRTFDDPLRGYDATLATAANPLTDTTAGATRRVKFNEPVWIEMGSHVSTDSAGSNANYMLRITGPLGVSDVVTDAIVMATAAKGYTWREYIRWTPTDSWPAENATQNYAFLVRMGTSAGNLTADRIGIKISSAAQV
jgi:hypothetical protein